MNDENESLIVVENNILSFECTKIETDLVDFKKVVFYSIETEYKGQK